MKIAIASGKGGTGKTFVSVNLAYSLEKNVKLLDCDVEEPNSNIFLKGDFISKQQSSLLVPKLINDLCDGCRICQNVCQFNAIVVLAKKAMVFEDLCHACGFCTLACPQKALYEVEHRIGEVFHFQKGAIELIEGRLDVGKALAVPLIRDVKSNIKLNETVIIDSPPGTSCPMVWAVQESDLVILVAESTPFGLHDFKLALESVNEMKIPCAVIINKDGLGDNRLEKYCQNENIKILGKIPYDRKIATSYSHGAILVKEDKFYDQQFKQIWKEIENFIKEASFEK